MKNIFFAFIVLAATSCQTEPVELEIPNAPERLVVATQYTDQGIFFVGLSKTFNALKDVNFGIKDSVLTLPDELLVEGATVSIRYNGQLIELDSYQKGVHMTDQLPEIENATYQLEIQTTDEQQTIHAQTQMQPRTQFDSVSVVKLNGSRNQYQFNYAFTQPNYLSSKQYYMVSYLTKRAQQDNNTSRNDYLERIAQSMLQQGTNFDLYSSDDLVDGRVAVTKVFNTDIHDTMVVTLTNIHADYYEFLKTFKRSKKLINQLKGEPIKMPSNIINGYGFFSLAPPDVKVVQIN